MAEYRDPPVVAPRPFGLFSVERPTQKPDGPWLTGSIWQPEACGIVLNFADALCATPAGTNEVQTITITGTPTGGTYTLTFNGQTTAAITYNANAAAVTAALVALPNVNSGDIVVTGTYPNFVVTYGGQYASTDMDLLAGTPSLTGGTAPDVQTGFTTQGVRTPKTGTSPATTEETTPFSVYVLRECRTVGDVAGAKTSAMNMLALAEEGAVEKEVWTRMSAEATNITPGALTSPEAGLAMLEEAIGDLYAGRPIIHASPNLASYLATKGGVDRHGTHLETGIGSMFVSGRGYPRLGPGGAPAAGSEFLIASGGMFIDRGTANVRGPFVVQSPLDNTQVALAERTYDVGYDCTPIAIRVTFPA